MRLCCEPALDISLMRSGACSLLDHTPFFPFFARSCAVSSAS